MQSKTSRRTFVKGLAATSLLGGLGYWRVPAWAASPALLAQELRGTEFDLLIGITAVKNNLTLVTDNIKDFRNIDGIKIENWLQKSS